MREAKLNINLMKSKIRSPCQLFFKEILKYQRNYSVVEKETLGLVLAFDHFDVYLGPTPVKIKIYTDHNPLTFLKTMKISIKG